MKIKHVHQYKLPNNRKIKGINFVCNRFTTGLENLIIRYEEIKNCINKNSSNNVIISLTSFPQRNEELFYTLKSLLNQESEVNGIVIWLAEEQYPQKKIPQKLKDLETYGVEFRFCDDLKSHKKYFYALQEYKDYCIITTDDDVIYPEDMVTKLIKAHLKFPKAVICNSARFIEIDGNELKPYREWKVNIPKQGITPSYRVLPIGEGGILYPPNCLDEDVFKKDLIQKYCLTADDLWLKYMAVKNGTLAVVSEKNQRGLNEVIVKDRHNKITLHDENVKKGKNDQIISALNSLYPEVLSLIKNEGLI